MQCPFCKNDMIILELNKVEIDYCINCKGIWLDAGELKLLYQNSSSADNDGFFTDRSNVPELKIRCPVCRRKMKKVEFKQTGIILDKCKNNHGYWFDKDELRLLLESEPDSNLEIIKLLKNIFVQ